MISVGAILWAGLMMTVQIHSGSEMAHPVIVGKLDRIEARQVKDEIMKMDERICKEPGNNYYREELLDLITQWEEMTKQKFPLQLLRCGNSRGRVS